jgi:hypothetical protein
VLLISKIKDNGSPVEQCEGGQSEEETDLEETHDSLEIVEQSALDHFNNILLKAQELAANAEREKPRKRPKRYDGKSKRTLRRRKKLQEDLRKKGYPSLFDFMARAEDKAKKKARLERLVTMASERPEQLEVSESEESEGSAPEELDTGALVSEHTGQVRRKQLLMHRD